MTRNQRLFDFIKLEMPLKIHIANKFSYVILINIIS